MSETGGGRRRRITIVTLECVIVAILLATWMASGQVRTSKSLVVLFFYSFPSEFLMGLVPHEPALMFFGMHHSAWLVALVAVVSTVMAEGMNYSVFSVFYESASLQAVSKKRVVARIIDLFNRRPFTAILVAGFTPVPFFPVRFLVVMTGYPVHKYLWGVFLSRAPRFWILAALGAYFEIPTGLLAGLFLAMLVTVNFPALAKLIQGVVPTSDAPSNDGMPVPAHGSSGDMGMD